MAALTDGVVAEAIEVLAIAEVAALLAQGETAAFTEAERAYASSKRDPVRRLAARLAAKRALIRLLGGDLPLDEVEVRRGRGGPPRLRLGSVADARLRALGATHTLVSLTHGETHAAAAVLLLRGA